MLIKTWISALTVRGREAMSSYKGDGTMETLSFPGTDLEIQACLANNSITIEVLKSGTCVHRVVLDHAVDPLEHAWLANLFAREEHVQIDKLGHQLDDYVSSLNTNQG